MFYHEMCIRDRQDPDPLSEKGGLSCEDEQKKQKGFSGSWKGNHFFHCLPVFYSTLSVDGINQPEAPGGYF